MSDNSNSGVEGGKLNIEMTKQGTYINELEKPQHGSTNKWSRFPSQTQTSTSMLPNVAQFNLSAVPTGTKNAGHLSLQKACFSSVSSSSVSTTALSSSSPEGGVEATSASSSSAADSEFVNHVQVFDHHAEFIEGDLSVEVSVSFNNGAVDELLELDVV